MLNFVNFLVLGTLMPFKIIIATLIAILLTACGTPSPTEIVTKETKPPVVIETYNSAPDISGKYSLSQGVYSYGSISKEIIASTLVIEKLDSDDFGFYYSAKVTKLSPDNYFGIFHYKDGKFYNRVLETNTTTSLEDNIELIKDDEKIKLTVHTTTGKRIIIWKQKVKSNLVDTQELEDALKEAKSNYIQIYKERFEGFTKI